MTHAEGIKQLFRACALLAIALFLVSAPTSVDARRSPSPLNVGTTTIDRHRVQFVIAQLDRVQVHAALGGTYVGETAWLGDIAKSDHAIAAINGGYFEAYRRVARKNLDQTTIVDGAMVFKGDVGSILYFDRDNHASIERIPLRIRGSLDGSIAYPNDWYAYWINRLPGPTGDTITIFTRAWGTSTGLSGGPQVQVTDGYVSAINDGPTQIPNDGYVIYFRGETRVADHFRIGRRVGYAVTAPDGSPLGDFANAREAIGGGPQLLVTGDIATNPAAEGFTDPKIFHTGKRSLVGVSQDQSEVIFAVADCAPVECARIMQGLGAYDAMELDGGASSGLWANGHYLVNPGREINNALVLTK
jgi:Phosphodiester glycosidase